MVALDGIAAVETALRTHGTNEDVCEKARRVLEPLRAVW